MRIDLGTCTFDLPDFDRLWPVQLVARGIVDELTPPAPPMAAKKPQPQRYARFFGLSISETPEGASETDGLDKGVFELLRNYGGHSSTVTDFAVKQGVAKLVQFKWRSHEGVNLGAQAVVHVNGIVNRTVMMAWLDHPKAEQPAKKQFDAIVASLDPAPRIIL